MSHGSNLYDAYYLRYVQVIVSKIVPLLRTTAQLLSLG